MRQIKVKNPILQGFHPDPCICKAKGKYYLITSTFEWTPGISLYESVDLVHWESKGGILRELNLEGIPDSAGIWAPALSYEDGVFYLIYTICKQIDGCFKDVENYVITASNMEGPWSQPVFVNASGFDPSMYHENGRHYIINPQWDYRPIEGHRKFNGLILQEFDMRKGMTGESKVVYQGSGWGSAEGPHLMKKDGYYYILAAEGGTGRHHSICTARSKSLWGPYEISPYTPMITAWEQDTRLKKSGHGNLVETDEGEWYLVHLCGRYLNKKEVCILGRETSIQKIDWTDRWPHLESGDCVPGEEVEIHVPQQNIDTAVMKGTKPDVKFIHRGKPVYSIKFSEISGFDELEIQEWITLRTSFKQKSEEGAAGLSEEGLHLRGGASLTSLFSQSIIARRLEDMNCEVTVGMRANPYHYSQTAGLVCYYNTKAFYYLYLSFDEVRKTKVLSILGNDNFIFSEPLFPEETKGGYLFVPDDVEEIHLRFIIRQMELQFFYSFDGVTFEKIGPVLDVSILSDEHVSGWAYTGTVAGITAVDGFNKDTEAIFTYYKQQVI